MTDSNTPKTDENIDAHTPESITWVQQELTPLRPRRAFGSRPALSIRNRVRSYYSPRPSNKTN